jgi:tetratricopeptide (TPR) repeat protein
MLIPGAGGTEPEAKVLSVKVRDLFKVHCYRCHGQDGTNEAGFNYVIDLRQLVGRRKVMPGEPSKSRLLKRMVNADDPMPPAEEKRRPSAEEIALVRKWIEVGAPPADSIAKRAFLSSADMLQAMRDDLEKAGVRERPFLRYFTLTHLYNAGLSAEELQSHRHGLSKLVNSLSWGKEVVPPKVIDAHQTILRIDLRDYQWNEKIWDEILRRNPYGVNHDTPAAKFCAEATRCQLPYVRADWFVAVAARPPLYHDILQLPSSERELEKLLRVDLLENIRQERVARAGFNSSGVSRNNRLIERHESGSTVYWKSYDFGGNTGKQNLFAQPLGPGDGDHAFLHDGGEIIFSLPNGLQAYLLADGRGTRIDKGPTAIVSDPRRPDRAVENGLSCMSCHARGIIEKTDQVRAHVLKNAGAFPRSAVEAVETLYPQAEKMTALMRADAKRFQEAVAKTGAPLSTTEPIAALAARFEAELDLPLLAAEVGVTSADLLKALERFPHLAKSLGPLRVEGGTVQRQVFIDSFQDLVESLELGKYQVSRNLAADRLIRRANAMLPGELTAALDAFNEALEMEPDLAAAHAGRGEVFRLRGDHAQAIAAYSEALRIETRSALFFNNRGLVLQQKGDLDKALADFDAALRLDPRFAVAYHNRGVAHYGRGNLDRAIADYTEAIQIDPKFSRAFNNRGYTHFDKEEFDEALADFNSAIKLDAKFAAAWNNRGLVHLRKNRFGQAIGDFSAAIRLKADFAQAYLNRSIAHGKQGNAAQAEADRKQALKLDPNVDRD